MDLIDIAPWNISWFTWRIFSVALRNFGYFKFSSIPQQQQLKQHCSWSSIVSESEFRCGVQLCYHRNNVAVKRDLDIGLSLACNSFYYLSFLLFSGDKLFRFNYIIKAHDFVIGLSLTLREWLCYIPKWQETKTIHSSKWRFEVLRYRTWMIFGALSIGWTDEWRILSAGRELWLQNENFRLVMCFLWFVDFIVRACQLCVSRIIFVVLKKIYGLNIFQNRH